MMGNNDGNNDAREHYASMERESTRLRDEVAELREMASRLWYFGGCLKSDGRCSESDAAPCAVCAAGRVVESWEEQ